MQDSLSLIRSRGGTVVAVSAENYESIKKTSAKTNASFSIIHDNGLKIMKDYDVDFHLDDLTVEQYRKYNIDFKKVNGDVNGANLPIPAVYVINRAGKIVYRFFDPDYRRRAKVSDFLDYVE